MQPTPNHGPRRVDSSQNPNSPDLSGTRDYEGYVRIEGAQPQEFQPHGVQSGILQGLAAIGPSDQNLERSDLGLPLSTCCSEDIRRQLESLAITNLTRNDSHETRSETIKQEPNSEAASPAPTTDTIGEQKDDLEPYWQLDPENNRFRHWDAEDGEWVYYPEEFD